MNSYGNISRILDKIKVAATPPRFTVDFLSTELNASGGSATPFIPFAKRLGLINSDGTPSDIYKRFRNPAQSKYAMAEAIRRGYPQLYSRNEYAHSLDKDGLAGLVAEATGLENSSTTLRAIVQSFLALKSYADFTGGAAPAELAVDVQTPAKEQRGPNDGSDLNALRLSYTITLNLPNTNDVSVFNAIFKALRENLL